MKAVFSLSIILLFSLSCKKQTSTNNYIGHVIFPTPLKAFSTIEGRWQFTDHYSGAALINGVVSFPLQSADSLINGVLSYDIQKKNCSMFAIPLQNKANHFGALYLLNSGNYIGITYNQDQGITSNGIEYFPSKFVLLDGKFNTLKYIDIPEVISSFSNIYSNGKGLYYFCARSLSTYPVLFCFDESISIKWWHELLNTPLGSPEVPGVWDVCFDGETSFHLVDVSIPGVHFGRILKLDADGNYVTQSLLIKSELKAYKIIKSENGFKVYGTYSRADKRQMLFVSSYDMDCNLIETNYIETAIFSRFDTYTFSFNSNIIDINGDNYFVVHINNGTVQDLKTNEAKLVKVSKKLNLEWAKTLDENRIINDRGLLKSDGSKVVSIGKSNWNGLEGFSFIQTDLDGNILN